MRFATGKLTCADETPAITAQQQYLSSRLDRLGRMITDSQNAQEHDNVQRYDPPAANTNVATGGYGASASEPNLHSGMSSTIYAAPTAAQGTFEDPGHLFLAPQSKARYVSPAHFAMISKEVMQTVPRLHSSKLT